MNSWPRNLSIGLAFGVILGLIFGFAHHGGFGWRSFLIAVVVGPAVFALKYAARSYGRRDG